MNSYSFSSALNSVITRYFTLKQALGRNYANECNILKHLDRYLTDTKVVDLTSEVFLKWVETQNHLTPGVRRNRMRIVRNLCLYRRRTESTCFVPDPNLFPSPHQPVQPYIFREEEITRLIQATSKLKTVSRSLLRIEVFRLAIVLLYTTGLRRGELLHLIINDYNFKERSLCIRESKFHKSRLLPLSSDAAREIDSHIQARRKHHLPTSPESSLIWNGYDNGRAYTATGLSRNIQTLFRIADIHTPDGRLPRIHDFRHTFAVHALLQWYRAGVDFQAKLPLLSTYMGHVSIDSTQYYLHFIEELAETASARFASCYGALVKPLSESNGGVQ